MPNVLLIRAKLLAIVQGKKIHNYVIRSGYASHVVVGGKLVDMLI